MKQNVPDYIKPYVDSAKQFEEDENYEQAISIYREALAKFPGIAVLHNNLGCVLANQEKYNEARSEFLEAITLTSINLQNGILTPASYPEEPMQNLSAVEAILKGERAYPARLSTAGSPLRGGGSGCSTLAILGIAATFYLFILMFDYL